MKTIVNGNKATATKIIEYVEQYYGLEGGTQLPSRKAEVVKCKQLARYLIRKHTKLGFKAIGRLTGNADHSTIIYSCSVWSDLIEFDKELASDTEYVTAKLRMNSVLEWQSMGFDVDKELARANNLRALCIAMKQRKDQLDTTEAIVKKKMKTYTGAYVITENAKISALIRLINWLEKKYMTSLIVQL
jgi:hypothetical protein